MLLVQAKFMEAEVNFKFFSIVMHYPQASLVGLSLSVHHKSLPQNFFREIISSWMLICVAASSL